MTDLGKDGGHPAASLPQPVGAFQRVGFSCPSGGSNLLFPCLSLSDEQEDESMETTGKVEPV